MPVFEPRADLSDVKQAGGRTTLEGFDIIEVLAYMVSPLIRLMHSSLANTDRMDLKPLVVKYMWFRVGLGMVRPIRVDNIWDTGAIDYNAYLSNLLSRREYYDIAQASKYSVSSALERCSAQWREGWELGRAATGDETIVPFKGKRAGNLRQFVPRKPHSTGLKLYCLADGVHAYIVDVYLYTGRRGVMQRNSSAHGKNTPAEMMHRWADDIPTGTALIADSFFGTLSVAEALHDRGVPFLVLTKRNTVGVAALGARCTPCSCRVAVQPQGFALCVYKNPKVGGKAARVVPFLTNCRFRNEWVHHHLRYRIPRPVFAYRYLAGGVETANQLSLQHREVGRCSTWSQAVRHFLIRYALTNAFVTCRVLGHLPKNETLWQFQWSCMKRMCGETIVRPPADQLHVPVRAPKRARCAHCPAGTSQWKCSGCGRPLHIQCFAAFHGLRGDA